MAVVCFCCCVNIDITITVSLCSPLLARLPSLRSPVDCCGDKIRTIIQTSTRTGSPTLIHDGHILVLYVVVDDQLIESEAEYDRQQYDGHADYRGGYVEHERAPRVELGALQVAGSLQIARLYGEEESGQRDYHAQEDVGYGPRQVVQRLIVWMLLAMQCALGLLHALE